LKGQGGAHADNLVRRSSPARGVRSLSRGDLPAGRRALRGEQTYEARPQILLRELREALQAHGVAVTTSSLSRFFARHRITRKKGRCTQLSRTETT
jgi:hypothetical protein